MRAGTPTTRIPNASLYTVHAAPTAGYLVETDQRFAGYREWRGSDYMLASVQLAPDVTQKRIGDGFYEQGLVRAQVAQLTGRRFLGDYSSDDQQYQALMDAGVAYAKQWNLRPGVALTPAQMAALSSDIVWLVEQDVTLADGPVQKVLAPQVYVRVQPGDLDGSGALLSGKDVNVQATGNLLNSGTIAGRDVVRLTADNVQNLGGRIHGDAVTVTAHTDLNNIGGTIAANSALVATAGRDIHVETTTGSAASAVGGNSFSHTNIDRVAALYVTGDGATGSGTLLMQAGRDIGLQAARIGNAGQDGATAMTAGRDIGLGTVTTASANNLIWDANNFRHDSATTEVGSQIQATGGIALNAGADLKLRAADLQAGGALSAQAGNNLDITAGVATQKSDVATQHMDTGFLKKTLVTTRDTRDSSSAVGSSLGGATVALGAGHDIGITAGQLTASGALTLDAGRDLLVTSAEQRDSERHSLQVKKSGVGISFALPTLFSYNKSQDNKAGDGDTVTQTGSVLSGGSVSATSGRDTLLKASTVVADNNVSIAAKGDLSVVSAANRDAGDYATSSAKSGSIGSTFQPAFGQVKVTTDGKHDNGTQVGSQIASLGGNVELTAGGKYTQTASQVQAPRGDIGIEAREVLVDAGYSTSNSNDHTTYAKTAIGGTVSVPLLDAAKGIASMATAAKTTKDARMQALAAVNLAASAAALAKTAQAFSNGMATGIKVSVSLGNSKSQSNTVQSSDVAVGSTITAGGDVSIKASGGGKSSNVTAIGADISAGKNVTLNADNQVNLLASESKASQHSTNSSSGASIGIGFAIGGQQNGFTLEFAASKARGNADGDDLNHSNTHVVGGNTVTVASAGDTNVKGGVIVGDTVVANVGGNLNVESLQDSSKYDSKQVSAGVGVSVCIPPFCYGSSSVSGSIGKSKVEGDFLSVIEQSGIKAGDGGFRVNVSGNTDLKGGVLSSSQSAIEHDKNSLTTATLTSSDLLNKDNYEADAFSASASFSGKAGDQDKAKKPRDVEAANSKSVPGGSAGVGSESGSQQSTTKSGISGGAISITNGSLQQSLSGKTSEQAVAALDRDVSSDKVDSGSLTKGWDGKALEKEVNAQVAITSEFGKLAAQRIGDYADAQQKQLHDSGNEEEAAKWAEGGVYRVAAHTAAGALGGGLSGAVGAGLSADLMPKIGNLIEEMHLPAPVQQALGAASAAAIGVAAGGAGGAGAAFNTDLNNRQLHPTETQRIHELANGDSEKEAKLTAAACAMVHCADGVPKDDKSYAYLKGLQDAGKGMTDEQDLLDKQMGRDGRTYGPLFQHTIGQSFNDALSQNRFGTRMEGALQSGLSMAGLTGDGLACSTGVGCALATVTGTVLVDNLVTGARKMANGQSAVTSGEQVLQSLGLSPQAAAATYAIAGVTPIAIEGAIASKAAAGAESYNSLAKASYSNFTTQGVAITADVMATPQVRALINEMRLATPALSDQVISDRAAEWISSGTSLPIPAIASQGSVLIKVVPKGDGVSSYTPFWMSPEQARAIATMTPEQAGQALGLPAAQASKMLKEGVGYYAISPISGASPKVFVSNVASTVQGTAMTTPSAQQVIVPNRGLWTTAKPVNPFTLR